MIRPLFVLSIVLMLWTNGVIGQLSSSHVLQVMPNGDVFFDGLKVTALHGGAAPKAFEVAEKAPPEEIPISDRANLFVYRQTRILANVRTGPKGNHCSIILTNHDTDDLPRFKYGGAFSFRGKRFEFSGANPLRRSDLMALLTPDERKMTVEEDWSFFVGSGSTSINIEFDADGVLHEIIVGMRAES